MPSSAGMGFYYHNLTHPPGEVFPAKVVATPLHNGRNQKWATEYRLHAAGDLIGESLTPAQVTARIQAIDSAYSQDYGECGFTINGALTPHRLKNSDPRNLSGNQVIHRSWDHVLPVEYANTRSFSVVIRAIFLDAVSDVIDFEEKVTKIGDGGPTWELYDTVDGPEKIEILPSSKVYHVQRGFVVGALGRLTPPPPLWPLEEQRWRRQITYHSPKYYGNPQLRKPNQFRTDYAYFFERLGPDATLPSNWYS